MEFKDFIQPKELVLGSSTFAISKLPLLPDGVLITTGSRELCTQWVFTGLPKIGDYPRNEALVKTLYKYVAVKLDDGTFYPLSTPGAVNKYVTDVATSLKLEAAMIEHNLGFSIPEKISTFLDAASNLLDKSSSEILTGLQAQLLAQTQASTKS